MMEFEDHPTEPNTLVIKMPKYYIAKYSYEDLRAAVLAERESCARLCDDLSEGLVGDDVDGAWGAGHCARAIEARGDMSTKSQNVDTSEERVQETEKSMHDLPRGEK